MSAVVKTDTCFCITFYLFVLRKIMEKYERYVKYKLKKSTSVDMESISFDNLVASINDGPLNEVGILYYRRDNFILVSNSETVGNPFALYLNMAGIDTSVQNQVLITNHNQTVRILFKNFEERLFFINEIQSDSSSSDRSDSSVSDGEGSGDSGNLS